MPLEEMVAFILQPDGVSVFNVDIDGFFGVIVKLFGLGEGRFFELGLSGGHVLVLLFCEFEL